MGLVKLTFIGDIMCTKGMINSFNNNGVFDFNQAFSQIQDLFSESDLIVGNLETPVNDTNSALSGEPYSFCAPIEFIEAIEQCGINCLTTANNHCLDRGLEGLSSTIDCLNKIGIKHTGTRKTIHEKKFITLKYESLRIAIVSYTYGTNAFSNGCYLNIKNAFKVNLLQHQELFCRIGKYAYEHPTQFLPTVLRKIYKRIFPNNIGKEVYEHDSPSLFRRISMKRTISKAKRNSDIVIMCLHTGGQFNSTESARTIQRVHELHKNGVNIVIANHEHVIHRIDKDSMSQGQVAAYSLGNFLAPYGIQEGPYDKYANYSIALNVYISTARKKIEKVPYNILQTIEQNGTLKVVNTYDLLDNSILESEIEVKRKEVLNVSYKTGFPANKFQDEYIIFGIS